MRRILLTVLLTAGIVAGVSSTIHSYRYCGHHHHHHHHHEWDHDHHKGSAGASERPATPKSENK